MSQQVTIPPSRTLTVATRDGITILRVGVGVSSIACNTRCIGFDAGGSIAMPGYDGALSSEARWDLIDYLHAHNAGESMHRSGKWLHPLPVPQHQRGKANGAYPSV
jgi:hypothetical protein